jgi:type IV secretory pathway VirD2 relaxase
VVVKVHYVKLTASGARAAALHLRYIERDGVELDGSKGVLYGPEGPARRESFEEPRPREEHQFRIILAPEDGHELDMTAYVRSFMARIEKDLKRKVEWAAVNHYDTDNPHAHIVIRGVGLDRRELRLDRGYISSGMRWRAQEIATAELGPRPERDVNRTLQREVTQERFTSLDRDLERRAKDGRIEMAALGGKSRPLLVARLEHLEKAGLAERTGAGSWTLAEGWREHLRDLGTRGDILKLMHTAMKGDPSRYRIVRPGKPLSPDGELSAHPVTGRVIAKGLSDELKGAFYVVVEAPDGHGYHVPLDARSAESLRVGDVVSLATRPARGREPARVAGTPPANAPEAQRRQRFELRPAASGHGPSPRQGPTDPHHRSGEPVGEPLPRAKDRLRLLVHKQPLDLGAQVHHPGPVWLDRVRTDNLAHHGFGAEVRRLVEKRRSALGALGIQPEDPKRAAKLRALAIQAVGRSVAERTGQRHLEVPPPGFRGRVQVIEAPGASYAVVSDGSRFVVVRATTQVRAAQGKSVMVSRDRDGRVVVRHAHDRDRGL